MEYNMQKPSCVNTLDVSSKIDNEISCGIFVLDKNGKVLICHASGSPMRKGWGIPKGSREQNETDLEAAIRETLEETSLNINNIRGDLKYIGEKDYSNWPKTIKCYIFKSKESLSDHSLYCSTTFTTNRGIIRVEIDSYKWATIDEALSKIHYAQRSIFEDYLSKHGI